MLTKLYRRYVKRTENIGYPVILPPRSSVSFKGRVLLSYLESSLHIPEDSPQFLGHSNLWESRAIAGIFQKLGYQVDAINWSDRQFAPTGIYEIVFDIFANLGRFAPWLDKRTIKLLHCTGSDPYYQNSAELSRVESVNQRRSGRYVPKRIIAEPEMTHASLEVADACSLIGNDHTLQTYPEKYWHKMELVTVSASEIGEQTKAIRKQLPQKREFLWFFGSGAVHKGLDLLLDVFADHPELQLHIVGNIATEEDFFEIYKKELTATENIHYHGYLLPSSREFREVLQDVFCFIAPTCSEGISPSVVTSLQLGLYPIISRDTGVTLPANCGLYIDKLTTAEIEKLVLTVMEMKDDEVMHQIRQTQMDALTRFSRRAFMEQMESYIVSTLAKMEKI